MTRSKHAMAWDVAAQRAVLFGGDRGAAETWLWDGGAWARATDLGPLPAGREGHVMASALNDAGVMLFGGSQVPGGGLLGDTWSWSGSRWSQVVGAGPAPRKAAAMALDVTRGVLVLFGGEGGAGLLGDTWEFDGAWHQRTSSAGPSARSAHAMAWDGVDNVVVLTGGVTTAGSSAETWTWNGAQWTRAADVPVSGLRPGIALHSMAWDGARQAVVIADSLTSYSSLPVLERRNGAWLSRATPGAPTPRVRAAMVYDPARSQLVLFGGDDGANYQSGTWLLAP